MCLPRAGRFRSDFRPQPPYRGGPFPIIAKPGGKCKRDANPPLNPPQPAGRPPPRPHRHSRESGNPAGRRPAPYAVSSSFPRKRESSGTPAGPRRGPIAIPAKAGIQRIPSPPPARPHRNSRFRGNPEDPRPAPAAALSSFPRKRESSGTPARPRRGPIVIPAKAGIQRDAGPPNPARPHRHSRESGNPEGPRRGLRYDTRIYVIRHRAKIGFP